VAIKFTEPEPTELTCQGAVPQALSKNDCQIERNVAVAVNRVQPASGTEVATCTLQCLLILDSLRCLEASDTTMCAHVL